MLTLGEIVARVSNLTGIFFTRKQWGGCEVPAKFCGGPVSKLCEFVHLCTVCPALPSISEIFSIEI